MLTVYYTISIVSILFLGSIPFAIHQIIKVEHPLPLRHDLLDVVQAFYLFFGISTVSASAWLISGYVNGQAPLLLAIGLNASRGSAACWVVVSILRSFVMQDNQAWQKLKTQIASQGLRYLRGSSGWLGVL